MFTARSFAYAIAALLVLGSLRAESDLKADNSADQSIAALEEKVAQHPDNLHLRYELGIAYNDQAMRDDEDALDQAIDTFAEIINDDPAMLKAHAMLGSCTVMKAQYVSIFKKMDYVKQGFGMLDEVVSDHPDDPELRLIRGINAARSPGFLGRSDVAEEDFEWLLADVQAQNNNYDDNYRRTIYFYVGDYFLEERDERCVELLLAARDTPGAPRLTDDIAQSLKKAKKKFPSTYADQEKK